MSRTLTLPRLPRIQTPHARRSGSAVVTGVRIGVDQVSLCTADGTAPPLSAKAAASAPLPWGAVRDGEVIDAAAVAAALRDAVAGRSALERRVRVGIGCQKVAVRVLELPPIQNEDDVATTVRMLARERVPTASDDALVDHRVLPPATEGGPRRALVVAARRELVDGHVAAVRAAGLEPVGVDLLAFGLSRAARTLESTLLLDLDGVATLALAGPDGCRFVRTVPAGLQSAADDLSDRTGSDPAAAAAAILGRPGAPVVAAPTGPDAPTAVAEPAAVDRTAADEAVERTIRAIAATARTSLEFHVEQEGGVAPVACVTSGPLAGLPGVEAILADALGLPVDPAARFTGAADPVALGLSVEEVRA